MIPGGSGGFTRPPADKNITKGSGIAGPMAVGAMGGALNYSAPRTGYTSTGQLGYTGGGGGGSYGGGGGGPIDPNAYMQDDTYQSQLAALHKALSDYQAQMNQNIGQYSTEYGVNTRDLGQLRDRSQTNNFEDYASRGLYFSGLMGKSNSDLLGDFARRQSQLDTAKSNYLSNLTRDFGNFKEEQVLSEQKAKQDALARASMGLGV